MAKLTWDKAGERYYELGVSKGVLYVQTSGGVYNKGVAWNGLTDVKQSPDGAESQDIYANNHKYASLKSAENFKGTIEAYTYPEEFKECDGSKQIVKGAYLGQQARKNFGFVYCTNVGNDTDGIDYGRKIHIIWGASANPSSKDYTTINKDPDAIKLSWEFTTTPQTVTTEGFKDSSYLMIETKGLSPETLKKVEDKLFGSDSSEPTLPTVDEMITLLKEL